MNVIELMCYVVSFEERPHRTTELENEIKIGTGFHNKWYRSQKEHWLGWLTYQAQKNGDHFPARKVWSGINCSPMLFWLAECAQLEETVLNGLAMAARRAVSAQKSAGETPKDAPAHGKCIRTVLSWDKLEASILILPLEVPCEHAHSLGGEAYNRLHSHPGNSRYKPKQRHGSDQSHPS